MNLKVLLTYREPHKVGPYAEALCQAGIDPVLAAPGKPTSLAGCRGLLLSGGTDLNPTLYGEPPNRENEDPDDERDALEKQALGEALGADLPVLAICRGMQLFNVAHGGTLIQHLDNPSVHRVRGPDPGLPAHEIQVEPGSRLAAILGASLHPVNSRHHQAIGRIGAGLRVTARSLPDGVIEALERDDRRFALAVQWHPEDQVRRDLTQRKLFEAFAETL